MDTTQVSGILREAVDVVVKLGAPILVLNLVVGVLVAIFQAVTQIHEQTISFILKLLVVLLVCLVGGGWMMTTLQEYTKALFTLMME